MPRLLSALTLSVVLVVTFFVYQPGLSGTFILDDNPTLSNNSHVKIQEINIDSLRRAAFSSNSGPLRRPISMLSFSLNYYNTGSDPFYFKLTNVFIHIVNGIGILIVSMMLLTFYRRRFASALAANHIVLIALLTTSAWLLHPLNITSVLYVTQRMTSLSALFTIFGLIVFLWGRIRLADGKGGISLIITSWALFTPLAALCKENGLLLPLFMGIIEVIFFQWDTITLRSKRFLKYFYAVALGAPLVAILTYIASNPVWLMASYASRDFTLVERVMTQSRVILFYTLQVILPSAEKMGLFHDDFTISTGLLQPVSTALSIITILGLVGIALKMKAKAPLVSFAIIFFLGGHVLESTIFPFELVHEHRNYFPMYGILLAGFFYLLYPLKYIGTLTLRRISAFSLIALFSFSTFSRASTWGDPFEFAQLEVNRHPQSARANSEMGDVFRDIYLKEPITKGMYYFLAIEHYEKSSALDVNNTHGLFGIIKMAAITAQPIKIDWLNELNQRLRYQKIIDSGNSIVSLINCRTEKICHISNLEIEAMLEAALQNKNLAGNQLAIIHTSKNFYLNNILDDFQGALHASYQAIEAAPGELDYRLNLVKFLLIRESYAKAATELSRVKTMDTSNIHKGEIKMLEKALASLTSKPEKNVAK